VLIHDDPADCGGFQGATLSVVVLSLATHNTDVSNG